MIVMIVILTSFNFEKKFLFKAMSFYKQFQTLIGNRTDGSENRSVPWECRLNQFTNSRGWEQSDSNPENVFKNYYILGKKKKKLKVSSAFWEEVGTFFHFGVCCSQ